jgi:hypothetical protein
MFASRSHFVSQVIMFVCHTVTLYLTWLCLPAIQSLCISRDYACLPYSHFVCHVIMFACRTVTLYLKWLCLPVVQSLCISRDYVCLPYSHSQRFLKPLSPSPPKPLHLTYSMEERPSWEANWFAVSQEIPRILWNPKVHYRIHKCPPPVILSHLDPMRATRPHFLKINFNIILPSSLGLPNGLFPIVLPTKTCTHLSCLPFLLHSQPSNSTVTVIWQ